MSDRDLVAVARVLKPFGLRGEVKVQPLTEDGEELRTFSRFFVPYKNQLITLHTKSIRRGGGHHYLILFQEFRSREEVEFLRGRALWVPRSELQAIEEPDTFYYHDLMDLAVVEDEVVIGHVEDIHRMGGVDILEIRATKGEDFMLPFVKEFILKVDLAAQRIVIRLPKGLR